MLRPISGSFTWRSALRTASASIIYGSLGPDHMRNLTPLPTSGYGDRAMASPTSHSLAERAFGVVDDGRGA